MKILVNDVAASSGGALSILKSFYEFAKTDRENEYTFLISNNCIEETDKIQIIEMPQLKRWIKRLLFDLFKGKKFIQENDFDAIISLQNTIIFGTKTKQILYVHQSIPFQDNKKFSFIKKEERKLAIVQYFIGAVIKKSIKKANYVIVQTNWMKKAVIEKTKVDKEKITVLPPAVCINENINVNTNFKTNNFFYPASNEIYKNHECIYKACKILNEKGTKDYSVELTIDRKSDIEQIKDLGQIKYDEVLEKYKKSILVFPSYIESFPLPLIEAKNIGTIVLTSKCKFSEEILQDYNNGYFFNPFKPEELAEIMEKCIKEKIRLRENRIIKELKQANWNVIIKKIGEGEK